MPQKDDRPSLRHRHARRAGGRAHIPATLTDSWNALGGVPNGGYLLAVCLNALAREMPCPTRVVVSATYLRPAARARPRCTPSSCAPAAASRPARPGSSRTAARSCASSPRSPTSTGRGPHDDALGAAGAARRRTRRTMLIRTRRRSPASTSPSGSSTAGRSCPGWARGEPTGDADLAFWMRFRDGRDADPIALAAMVDAAAPAVLEIGAHGSATIELTVHIRRRPAPGWLACRATHAPPDRRLPRRGLRDLGLDRRARGAVAPVRIASPNRLFRRVRGASRSRALTGAPRGLASAPVQPPAQIYASAADRRERPAVGRRRHPWMPAALAGRRRDGRRSSPVKSSAASAERRPTGGRKPIPVISDR